MMKQEFDNLVGIRTDPDCYERIEYVYMNCDLINNKEHIARIYNKYDMNGIESIYHTITGSARSVEEMEHAAKVLRTTL